ncbi:DHH family phosphoesterase [archaeon]|nr:DHH family phosphoesterase [archaeon]
MEIAAEQARYFRKVVLEYSECWIATHVLADIDAVASVAALVHILQKIHDACAISLVFPEGVAASARALLSLLPQKLIVKELPTSPPLLILVDVANPRHTGWLYERVPWNATPCIVIDHHQMLHQPPNTVLPIVVPEAAATSEIIWQLARHLNIHLPADIVTGLLAGILVDSKNFTSATPSTFRCVADMLEAGGSLSKARELTISRPDISERIARLKAARRIRLFRSNEWLIAVTRVGSHQASAANALISMGADLAVVYGIQKKELRISLRCTPLFRKRTGINLATDLAKQIAELLGGSGGGHPAAAAVKAPFRKQRIESAILSEIERLLPLEEILVE